MKRKDIKWEYKINLIMLLVMIVFIMIAGFFMNQYLISSVDGTSFPQISTQINKILIICVLLGFAVGSGICFYIFGLESREYMVAQELTGIKTIVDALRAYNHEFMNKLHVILGLMQLECYDEAKNYILQVTSQQQQILSNIMSRIKDMTLAGLLIGKSSRSKEMNVELIIDEMSIVDNLADVFSDELLVLVIGNLIDNALEATEIINNDRPKKVTVFLKDDESNLHIRITDSGVGIAKENLEKIFVRGYSSKPVRSINGSRGIGLAIVKKNLDRVNGEIRVISVENEGSTFMVTIPKGRKR